MIDHSELAWNEVLFAHYDDKTQIETCISITRLLKDRKVRMQRVFDLEIDPVWAQYCLDNRGIEEHRLKRCVDLKGEYAEPVLYVHWGDGSKLHVDGVHRYVASWYNGYKQIKARILPVTVWRPYVVTGIPKLPRPDKLRDSFSGIV